MLKTKTNILRSDDGELDPVNLRRKWYRRIVLFKDGALQGWFVNTIWTFFTMTMLGVGFFTDTVRWGWEKYGGIYATIYLGGMTAWFAYKVAKGKVEGTQETAADALKKVMESITALQSKNNP